MLGLLLLGWAGACGGAAATGPGASDGTGKPEATRVTAPPPDKTAVDVTPEPSSAPTAAENAPAAPPPADAAAEPVVAAGRQEIAESPGAPDLVAGADAIKRRDWLKGRMALDGALSKIEATASLDVLMAGHALIGRACVALKDDKCAAGQFSAVTALWKDPDAAQKKLEALGGDDAAKFQRLGRACLAEGEALFFAAEQKRKEVEKLHMPIYKGSGSRDDVMKHVKTKIGPWFQQKRPLIEEAQKAYAKILEIRPAPPPRWVIDAAARVGSMWGRYVAEFRATPVPKEWKKSGPVPGGSGLTYEELRKEYYAQMDAALEPMKVVARGAFEKCRDLSVKFRYEDELSRTCEHWIAKNSPPSP